MKKRFICLILTLLFIPNIVRALGANVSISAPDSVYVGDTVNVSVTVSSGSSLGSWDFTVGYDDSKLSYSSSTSGASQTAAGYAQGGGQTSVTYTWTFKAIASGNASFNINGINVYAFDDDSQMSIGGSTSTSINVVKPSSGGSNGGSGGSGNNTNTQPDYKYEYSSDNSLSSLNVEGFDISFDPSVTEYSVSVPNDTKKVSVGATANDGKASVSGIGDYDVKEGSNKIEVLVTAENGETRTYTIDVVVKEESPIEVSVGDEKFTVVRKADKLPRANATYSSSTILIKGESIPCYHSDITDIYLVGLMNDKGKIKLYRYLASNDKFSDYTEVNIGGLYLILTDTKDIPNGYTSGKVTIDGKEYDAFLKDGYYPLLHGINLETGNEGLYNFDETEKTIQRYNGSINGIGEINSSIIIYVLVGLCIFEFIMIILSVVSKNKKLKSLLHDKLDTKTEFEKISDISYNDEDNITDDLTDQYMSDSEQDDNESVDSELDDEVSENSDDSLDEGLGNDSSSENIENNSSYENEEKQVESSDLDNSNDDVFDELSSSDETDEWDSDSKNYKEFSDDTLGHTALISRSVSNVYNNSVNRKEDIKRRKALRKRNKHKKDDDEMFKF